jgi:hypothetical protein
MIVELGGLTAPLFLLRQTHCLPVLIPGQLVQMNYPHGKLIAIAMLSFVTSHPIVNSPTRKLTG